MVVANVRETLPLVINHCRPLLQKCTDRHNKIVKRINASSKRWILLYDNQSIHGTGLKPDLVLDKNGHVLILDIACPFDNGIECFHEIRRKKVQKYKPLIDVLSRQYKTVAIEAIIVGPLRTWDPKNDRILLRLCTKRYLRLMKKLIVSESIRSSRDIFYEHIWGRPHVDYKCRRFRGQHRPVFPQEHSSLQTDYLFLTSSRFMVPQ